MTIADALAKTVFLTGAGASKFAGCKLSDEMLNDLRASISAISDTDADYWKFKTEFQEILQLILASLQYQISMRSSIGATVAINIEDLVMTLNQLIDKEFIIPYPLIGNWNSRIISWELHDKAIFESFKKFIVKRLVTSWTTFDQARASELLQPIKDFIAGADDLRLNIFTLNYDLTFEETFNTEKLTLLSTGFSERMQDDTKTRYWTGSFSDDLNLTKVNLYKVHGSVNWHYESASDEISIREEYMDGNEPLIIFGSYSKMLSFDPFLFILSEFRRLLNEATVFVVVGYSFHDKYINNLLIQQLSLNTTEGIPKKLIVVDPAFKDKNEEDFAQYLRAIQESKSVNEFINIKQISPDRIKLVTDKAEVFYKSFFENNAKYLLDELALIEAGERKFG